MMERRKAGKYLLAGGAALGALSLLSVAFRAASRPRFQPRLPSRTEVVSLRLSEAVSAFQQQGLITEPSANSLRFGVQRGYILDPISLVSAVDIAASREAEALLRQLATRHRQQDPYAGVRGDVIVHEDVKLLALNVGLPVREVARRWAHWHTFTDAAGKPYTRWHAHAVQPTYDTQMVGIGMGGVGGTKTRKRVQAADLQRALDTGGPASGQALEDFRWMLAMDLPHGKAGLSRDQIVANFERGYVIPPKMPRRKRKEPGFWAEVREIGADFSAGRFSAAVSGLDDPFATAWRGANRSLGAELGFNLDDVVGGIGGALEFVSDNAGTIGIVLAAGVLVATGAGAPGAIALLGVAYGPIVGGMMIASAGVSAVKTAVTAAEAASAMSRDGLSWDSAGALLSGLGGAIGTFVPGGSAVAGALSSAGGTVNNVGTAVTFADQYL